EELGVAAPDRNRPGTFQLRALQGEAAEGLVETLVRGALGLFGDEVHHAARIGLAVNRSRGPANEFDSLVYHGIEEPELGETVAQRDIAGEASQREPADIAQAVHRAGKGELVGKGEDPEVFYEVRRHGRNRVGQLFDPRGDPRTGRRFGGCVATMPADDIELR